MILEVIFGSFRLFLSMLISLKLEVPKTVLHLKTEITKLHTLKR